MSVYTHINQQQLEAFLEPYALGKLKSFSGIQSGIENTNYIVVTTKGRFILTLFEVLTKNELPDYLDLMTHLCLDNFPAPKPQTSKTGQLLSVIKNKPAALFNCLSGCSIEQPSENQCQQVGTRLAELHLSTKNYNFRKPNKKNLFALQSIFNKITAQLEPEETDLVSSEMSYQTSLVMPDLPKGTIHADLFRDNVLFEHGQISGILDYYNACTDYFLFDIAITINDWCTENATIKPEKLNTFLSGYQKTRSLQNNEKTSLPVFLRLAALRFYLSRLNHLINPKPGELTLTKDPLTFRQLLEHYRTHSELLNDLCLSTQ